MLNKENIPTQKSLIKLHISVIGDSTWSSVQTRCTLVIGLLTTKQLKLKKEHNKVMLEITSYLRYSKYSDIKNWCTAKVM